jgi:GT2 family glycosyltransferase
MQAHCCELALPSDSMTQGSASLTVDISVIVPTFNRSTALRHTVECLLGQEPRAREIIVVDQSAAHDPETKAALEEWVARGQIVYFAQSEPNAQRARNRGIAAANGSVLLFVDDDIKCDATLVGAHWRNYQEDPELAAVGGFFTDPGEAPTTELPAACGLPFTGWIYTPNCYARRHLSYQWPSCNGSVRRDVALAIGGFDENFGWTLYDDTDFSCRLMKIGAKVVHDPCARLQHLKVPAGGRRPDHSNEYVIADSNGWYTWCYFFFINFGWRCWREIAMRLRSCVFRRKNIAKPWYFVFAFACFAAGTARALLAITRGRRLPLRPAFAGNLSRTAVVMRVGGKP